MTKTIILGQPQGKGRPRVTRRGTYTPKKTKDYQKLVQTSFISQNRNHIPSLEPIEARLKCFYQIPKAASKVKREKMIQGEIRPVVKPDLDNVAKAVLDALNGLAYKDDNQIISLKVEKYYDEVARVEAEIREVKE